MAKSKQADRDAKETGKSKKRSNKFIVGIVISVLIPYLILIAVAIWKSDLAERVKFGTENGLSLAILIAVIAQVLIYREQWHVMDQQWRATKEGLKDNRLALEIVERARLGIHSIRENFETGRVVMRIENTGKAPAADIEVFAEGVAHIPESNVPDEITKASPWKRFGNGWRLTWSLSVDYGNTTLLAGNNPLILPFSLNNWLNLNQRKVMEDGSGYLIFRGHIDFHDGFRGGQKSEFGFKYSKRDRDWIHHPINTPEDVWERLREQSEQKGDGEGEEQRAN
jgi:hypothetical protein